MSTRTTELGKTAIGEFSHSWDIIMANEGKKGMPQRLYVSEFPCLYSIALIVCFSLARCFKKIKIKLGFFAGYCSGDWSNAEQFSFFSHIRTDHVAKENISRAATHIRSILELDFQIPEAKTGLDTSFKRCGRCEPPGGQVLTTKRRYYYVCQSLEHFARNFPNRK